VKFTKRSSWSWRIVAAVESASSGVIEPLVSSLDRQAVEIDRLADARVVDREVALADRREDRVHRDQADHVLDVLLLVGRHVAARLLDADFHLQLRALRGQRGDVVVRLEDLDVGVRRDVARRDFLRAADGEREHLRLVAVQLDRQTLEVEQQVGRIFDHARNRRELVQHAVDLDVRDRRARNGREQDAPQRVAERDAEAALERLDHELGVVVAPLANLDGSPLRRIDDGHVVLVSFVATYVIRPDPVGTIARLAAASCSFNRFALRTALNGP
jgi:hypothetical protein